MFLLKDTHDHFYDFTSHRIISEKKLLRKKSVKAALIPVLFLTIMTVLQIVVFN